MKAAACAQGREPFPGVRPRTGTVLRVRWVAQALLLRVLLFSGAVAADDIPYGDWRGPIGLAVSLASGNTTSRSAALNADLSRRTEFHKTTFQALATWGSTAGVTTANRVVLNGEYQRDFDEPFFALGKVSVQRDRIQQLSLRTASSLGLGAHLVRTSENDFDVFTGIGYSADRYGVPRQINGRSDRQFSRAELLFGEETVHRIRDGVLAKQRLEFYPGISGDNARRANFHATLAVAITLRLSLTVSLSSLYNSRPPAGLRKTDTLLLTGLSVVLWE